MPVKKTPKPKTAAKKTAAKKPVRKPVKKTLQNEQNELAIKKDITPKKAEIIKKKSLFIQALRELHGNTTEALEKSGLKKTLAFEHFRTDPEFKQDWLDAIDASADELYSEGWRRAKDGLVQKKFTKDGKPIIDPETGEQYTERVYSDTLLIFLLRKKDSNQKWREKIIKIGDGAIKAIRTICEKHNVANEIIVAIEDEMLAEFDKVNLV